LNERIFNQPAQNFRRRAVLVDLQKVVLGKHRKSLFEFGFSGSRTGINLAFSHRRGSVDGENATFRQLSPHAAVDVRSGHEFTSSPRCEQRFALRIDVYSEASAVVTLPRCFKDCLIERPNGDQYRTEDAFESFGSYCAIAPGEAFEQRAVINWHITSSCVN